MTELQLYKFVNDNCVEWNRFNDEVFLFVNFDLLKDFTELLGPTSFDENQVQCILKDTYVCITMNDICDSFGIDIENIFPKN